MVFFVVTANTDGRRTVFSCPCGHAIEASARAIVRRDSKITPHDPHRYSYVGTSLRARAVVEAAVGEPCSRLRCRSTAE